MTEIYYTEDDRDIAEGVRLFLEEKDFKVTVAETVSEMKLALLNKLPALILLDQNLPDGSGDALCGWIRRRFGEDIPILFLTVKNETDDVVKGFQNGADDYITKPFDLEILYSRITAILRRSGNRAAAGLFCDRISLYREKTAVYLEEDEVPLNKTEYLLLLHLLDNKGKTVSRETLLEQIWDVDRNYVNDNTLTVTMKRLRKKLGDPSCIKTIRSFGYRMEDTL